MCKESLFELVRSEEVVIWAGAGLSMSAGYPSGSELAEILHNSLSEPEKTQLSPNTQLSTLTEEICRIKNGSRNHLIKLLKREFLEKEPILTECHNNIALIPHFRTVITTNYDSLIEDAYKYKGQLAYSANQIPYLENNKTHILKVHGDLQEPDSVVITDSDYERFFKSYSENNVYWTVVKERLATKNVLFLGYSLEDSNIRILLDKVSDELGKNRKECFLVAPNLSQHKINDLIRKGIHYIDSKADILIAELLQNIKENAISDVEKGKTSEGTFNTFAFNLNLLPGFKAQKEGLKVDSLNAKNGELEGLLNLSLKNDPKFLQELNDIFSGKKIGSIDIPKDKLIGFEMWYGDLKSPESESFSKFQFSSVPKVDTRIDICFEDGFEVNDLPAKAYGSSSNVQIHLQLKSAELIFNFALKPSPESKLNIQFAHKEICRNVNEEIETFTFLKKLISGEIFTIYHEAKKLVTKELNTIESSLDENDTLLNHFKNLKRIENFFKLRFSNMAIDSITSSLINEAKKIVQIIDCKKVKYPGDGELEFGFQDISYSDINNLEKIDVEKTPFIVTGVIEEKYVLHSHEIILKYEQTLEVSNPHIVNLDRIKNMKKERVKIKSENKNITLSYNLINASC